MAKALVRDIIPRFVILEIIYSDSGTQITLMAQNLKIDLKNRCSFHHKSAGLEERHNGILKSQLRKAMEETGKSWIYCQPSVLLNMHITPTAEGLISFEKLYGRPYVLQQLKPFQRNDKKQ